MDQYVMSDKLNHTEPIQRWVRWLIPLLIVALAAFLRLYRLGEVPPAFNFDEAAHATDAVDILAGHHFIFSPKLGGVEAFYMYVVAGAFYLLGPTPYAQRLVSALVGIATIWTTYLMVREMFADETESRRTWLAALTALGLATSFWHLNYSRIGFEVGMVPLFATLSFYFLWRGLRSGKAWDYAISGAWMGLGPYTHLPARFLPLPVVLFFVIRWLSSLRSAESAGRSFWDHVWQSFRPLVIVGGAALIVFAPLAYHFISYPADFLGRASATYILNPAMNKGDLWGTLARSVLGTFGAFGFTSDHNWLANLPGKSILNPVLAGVFWLGVLLTLLRIRKRPYLFSFLWWFTLLLPAIITPERTPHYARMIVTAPVAYLFPAIGLVALSGALESLLNLGQTAWFTLASPELRYSLGYAETPAPWQIKARRAVWAAFCLAVALLFGLTGVSTFQDYFNVWAHSDAHYMAFDGYAVELTQRMTADTDPRSVYVIPRDIRAGEFYQHYTIDFLHRGGAPHFYVPMNEPDVPRLLTAACQGKDVIHLVKWKMDKHREADPKDYVGWLLEKFGQRGSTSSFPAYDLVTYFLPSSQVDFTISPRYAPVEISFGGKLLLKEAVYGNAAAPGLDERHLVPSGGLIWLTCRWEKQVPFAEDYRVSLILEDERGHVTAHEDRDLLHNWHTRTSGWAVGDAVSDYYLLPVPADTPPGNYVLRAVVYAARAGNMDRLPADDKGRSGATPPRLGRVEVLLPDGPALGEATSPQHKLRKTLGDGLRLRGFDLDLSRPYPPGGKATLALHWNVAAEPQGDDQVAVSLRVNGQPTVLSPAARPLGDTYPTTRWGVGEMWRGLYDLQVPPDVPAGQYDLVVTLTDSRAGQVVGELSLGQMTIVGRARQFSVPAIRNPQTANLGGKVQFLGYDLDSHEPKPGQPLRLTLYWQSLSRMDTGYTVFVHLLDADHQMRGQRDSVPGDGEAPTTGWVEGEVITDAVEVPLEPELQPGTYTLEIGMYDATNGRRLSVLNETGQPADDRILLGQVTVR